MTITCRHCGKEEERTEELSAAATETGVFMCIGCLTAYWALLTDPAHQEPRASRMPEHMASLDPSFLDALSAPVPEEALREKLQGFPEEMRPRVLQHLGGRR
jgi:hypothetical protein